MVKKRAVRKSKTKTRKRRAPGSASGVGTAVGVGASIAAATGHAGSLAPTITANLVGVEAKAGVGAFATQPTAVLSTQGVIEPPSAATQFDGVGSVKADSFILPAPVPITPTVYPDSPQGTVIIQNYVTINGGSVEFKTFNTKMDALVKQLQFGRSNEISGEVCAQLLSEITAGRELLKGPKANRDLIQLLLVKPLEYLTKTAASAIIGKLAGEALHALLTMIL